MVRWLSLDVLGGPFQTQLFCSSVIPCSSNLDVLRWRTDLALVLVDLAQAVSFCLLRKGVIIGHVLCCCVWDKAVCIKAMPVLCSCMHFCTASVPLPISLCMCPPSFLARKHCLDFCWGDLASSCLFQEKNKLMWKHWVVPLIISSSKTDLCVLRGVFFCHINEEIIVFVSGQTCWFGLNLEYIYFL